MRYRNFLPQVDQKVHQVLQNLPRAICFGDAIRHDSIGIFESPKCDVNPQPNTRGIGPLVGRTSGNRRSVMHVLTVIFRKKISFLLYLSIYFHSGYIVW